jgi:hypothetical protein
MWQVTIHHHDKAWLKGDLCDDLFLIAQECFKTRTAGKKFIEDDLPKRHCKVIHRQYHKGDEPSSVWAYTGMTWEHENTGELQEEYYRYVLKKVKLR